MSNPIRNHATAKTKVEKIFHNFVNPWFFVLVVLLERISPNKEN